MIEEALDEAIRQTSVWRRVQRCVPECFTGPAAKEYLWDWGISDDEEARRRIGRAYRRIIAREMAE